MSGKRPAECILVRVMKREKKQVIVKLSDAVTDATVKKQMAEAWSCRTPFSHESIVMDMEPFLHCVIPNFIQKQDFLEELQKELLSLNFHEKYNDLYKFQQSDDLKKRREPHISALRKLLYQDFRIWLSDISDINLEPTLDISCAKYEFTDALLCHDDELEGRRFAFILYLVPSWDSSFGGTLDLYSVDEHFQPKQIVKSFTPSWNKLVFFEVSPVSFHQVSEVLSAEKSRLSISGWFHGPSLTRPLTYIEPMMLRSPHIPQDHEILYEWINPTYLDMDYQVQIQEEFEERSEILLKDFLKPEKFEKVCEALEKEDVEWSSRGPPNKRYYEKAEESKLPDILKDCMRLFRSEAMFLLLSNFTGLKLHFLAPSEDETEGQEEAGSACAADSTEEGTSQSSSMPENEQAVASNDYAAASNDYAATSSDHAAASSDHAAASSDHAATSSDHAAASNDHAATSSDHAATSSDHAAASNDHATTSSDHAAASNDHAATSSDHAATSNDHQQNSEETEPEEDKAEKEPSVPMCQGELRRWKTGYYTLIHDNIKTEFALDLLLYCGSEGWEPEYGGFTSYIAKGEDEELLTVSPENNSLALVYRDKETLKFVKHINHRSLEQKKTFPNRSGFWDFAFVYYE